ncbi:cellulase family glycosylhydrolase [Gordonia sp. ABSL49_1]|uniref:cellulase family glycosylhydrolase n=1 Tax=Gordonia sp. ABSL49_1 TaxID=2920941 RepID=UPI001F0F8A99|nr:cellulase family glycosylhydrolase [Gordonia sp. ABSL49_1]MCH5645483.1 glycoside hydrolase family 5 protein [Gordonia sp. ABSL49_1]
MQPATSSAAIRLPVGVATVSTMYSGTDYTADSQGIAYAGAQAIRIPAKWNLIQPGAKQSYTWSELDDAVTAARAAGLSILMNLEGPAPVWAQKPGANPFANGNAPDDPADFQDFAAAVAKRYSSRVTAWEIWNEPNLSRYLIPPTAAEYVPLLKAAYTGIRSAGSGQPVITGGTSSSRENTRDTTFISDMYALGASSYFNGIGVHPYTFPYGIAQDPRYGDGGGAAVIYGARSLMVANGDSAKSIWITEFGFPTGSTTNSVSEANQSKLILDAINRANSLSWIAVFFIFNSQDLTSNKSIEDGNFGLYRYNDSAKPIVAGLRSLLE